MRLAFDLLLSSFSASVGWVHRLWARLPEGLRQRAVLKMRLLELDAAVADLAAAVGEMRWRIERRGATFR